MWLGGNTQIVILCTVIHFGLLTNIGIGETGSNLHPWWFAVTHMHYIWTYVHGAWGFPISNKPQPFSCTRSVIFIWNNRSTNRLAFFKTTFIEACRTSQTETGEDPHKCMTTNNTDNITAACPFLQHQELIWYYFIRKKHVPPSTPVHRSVLLVLDWL